MDSEDIWRASTPVDESRRGNGHARHAPKFAANPGFISPRLKVIDPVTFDGKQIPERPWLVHDWIPAGQTTLLSGAGGNGKSLLAMMLATCCAIGRDWLGQKTKACKALYVACEDDPDELARRQMSINEYFGITFGDLEGNLLWLSRIGQDNVLATWDRFGEEPAKPSELFDQIHRETQEHGIALVVLDSLHDFFGGNENNRLHARQFVQLTTSLARDMENGAVVILQHPSQAGMSSGSGESGSTAWRNAARSHLFLTKAGERRDGSDGDDYAADRDKRLLRKMKANYSRAGDEIALTWREGVFEVDQQFGGAIASIESGMIERLFLDCLDAATGQGRDVTFANNSSRYAPKLFSPMPQAKGATKRQLEVAMNVLFAKGDIVMGSIPGPDRHPRKAIIRSAGSAGSGVASA